MQPRTATTPSPRGDEAELYRRHHRDLQRAVAHAVNAPRELIEDACQTAWATLLRTQPDRYAIFAWLRVVAIHEAYRLSAIERRQTRLANLRTNDRDREDLIADPRTLDDAFHALEALCALAALPPPAPRSYAQGRRLHVRGDPHAHRRSHLHERQQVAGQGPAADSTVQLSSRLTALRALPPREAESLIGRPVVAQISRRCEAARRRICAIATTAASRRALECRSASVHLLRRDAAHG